MLRRVLVLLFPVVVLIPTGLSAADLGNLFCAASPTQSQQAPEPGPELKLPDQPPAPENRDHTCMHFCRQQYNQCLATCLPGSCWVCFPNYENCLDNCFSG